ncbi:Hypothetical protein A7982_01005 [Minicystis rosea]|nr:Hypothetical protein A7982_01005 [Minicystis rosea]
MSGAAPGPWLFSRRTDLLAFGAPALVSSLLVAFGLLTGWATGDTPPGLWLLAVVGVDVAHVWSTAYRVYADPAEVRRRPLLYLGTPVLAWLAGAWLHWQSPLLFWRVLAYLAVFHFVRQQYGWVMLYRRRARETDRVGRFVDAAAVYAATLYPLLYWHAAPPRRFHWFVAGDFMRGLPAGVVRAAFVGYVVVMMAYVWRAINGARRGMVPWGKHLVVASTAVCWWVGIVAFDSDYVFTVTNVLIHGVPYFVLVHRYGARRFDGERGVTAAVFRAGVPVFYGILVMAAFLEEGLWDAFVWHDHPRFFGAWGFAPGPLALSLLVPLLALPQAVHYALDAFVWKVGPKNPGLAGHLSIG